MRPRLSLAPSLLAVLVALPAVVACQSDTAAPIAAPTAASDLSVVTRPIVNGDTETGWAGVGALTIEFNGHYGGSFCSATLIAPSWVMTAGHCVTGPEIEQQGIKPSNTRFMVGNDARSAQGGPADGTLYAVDAFLPHPNYNPNTNSNDIALVHLTEPITGVDPYAFQAESIVAMVQAARDANVSLQVFTVGFGATEGIHSSGSGLKRSTTVNLDHLEPLDYVSNFVDSGTCFGDSGGPGFADVDGVPHVVGITSAGYGCSPFNPNCDPCQTATVSTRVDVYADWIQTLLEGGDPTCQNVPAMCLCGDACLEDGSCDDTVCHVADCRDTYNCANACDTDECKAACVNAGTPEAQEQVAPLLECAAAKCADAGTPGSQQHRNCVRAQCSILYNVCTGFGPTATGEQDCAHVYDCMGLCQTTDCQTECQNAGTLDAQGRVSALTRCLRQQCRNEQTDEAYQACAHEKCQGEIDACFPDVSGDADCASIGVCREACDEGAPSCRRDCYNAATADAQVAYDALRECAAAACTDASGAITEGCPIQSCAAESLMCTPEMVIGAGCDVAGGDCPSGTACVGPPDGTACAPTAGLGDGEACAADATPRDCADGLECLVASDTSGGVCGVPCEDGDGDGVCVDLDCDDTAAQTFPGAEDVCGDGIDQDCDGTPDDGCVSEPIPVDGTSGKKSSGCAGGADATGLLALGAALLLLLRRRRATV